MLIGAFLFVTIIVFAILDINNVPSKNGSEFVQFDWINTLAVTIVGLLTLYFTLSVAETQKRIEGDRIASEKYFEIHFIEKYQKIIIGDDTYFRIKIKELDKDLLKSFKLGRDITVTPIIDGKPVDGERFTMIVDHEEHAAEHTDDGMDKDCLENEDAFCFIRVNIKDNNCLDKFEKNGIYRLELQIVARDIFGVEVKCRLCPWFKVVSKDVDDVSFSLNHSFGYYDSVRYIGNKKQ